MTPEQLRARLLEAGLLSTITVPEGLDTRNDDHLDAVAGQLLQRFRVLDDVPAYALLVELCQHRLGQIATNLVQRLAMVLDPEDLVASFMARLFTDVRRDQPVVQHFLGLGYTAMRFEALNQLRLLRRAQKRGASWEEMMTSSRTPGDPLAEADQRERVEGFQRLRAVFLTVVSACYGRLKPRERLVLHLREIEHLDYARIAARMDVPRTQVGMVLKRARDRFAGTIISTMHDLDRSADRFIPQRKEPDSIALALPGQPS